MIVPQPSSTPSRGNTASMAAAEAIVFGHRVRRDPALARLTARIELSQRERQILALASHGLSNADVAATLELSIETIKSHMRRVLGKLGARNRCHAVALGYEHGILVPGAPNGDRPAAVDDREPPAVDDAAEPPAE